MKLTVSLEKLQSDAAIIQRNAEVSMEGITDMLPNFFTDVKNFVNDVITFTSNTKLNLLDGHGFLNNFRKTDYTDLMEVEITVPAGFHGRMLDYVNALKRGCVVGDNLTKDILNPFNVWLGLVLIDPTRLQSHITDRTVPGLHFHDIATLQKNIAPFLNTANPSSSASFGSVFNRNQDWVDTVKEFNDVVASVSRIKNSDIVDIVKGISKNIDELMLNIKTNPTVFNCSANSIKTISTLCFTMAKECEFYAYHRHLVDTLQLTLLDTEKALKGKISADKLTR